MSAKVPVTIEVKGEVVTFDADLPEVFKALADALPLVTSLFGDSKVTAVNSRDMHDMCGGTYKHSAWVKRAVDTCNLIEDVDYHTFLLDANDKANWQAIAQNKGKVPSVTFFTPKAAAKIAIKSNAPEGDAIFNYMHAVTELVTPTIVKKYDEIVAEHESRIKSLSTSLDESERDMCLLSKQRGAPNVDTALVEANRARISATALQEHPVLVKKCELYANAMKSIGEATTNPDQIERILRGTRKALVLANEGEMFSTRWETWAD